MNLLPEIIAQSDGVGQAVELPKSSAKLLVFTLGITRAAEQQSLDVTVWGSDDQKEWGEKPIAVLPQKFYCGVYSMLVNLSSRPDIKYLRVQWKMKRWARGGAAPLFGFYSFLEESGARLVGRAETLTHRAVA